LLRSWLEESRDRLRQLRKLESAAEEWRDRGQKPDDLLQGRTLTNAQQFQKEQTGRDTFNPLVESFVTKSVKQRRLDQLKFFSFLVIPTIVVGLSVESYLREEGVKRDYQRLNGSSPIEERAAIQALRAGCDASRTSGWFHPFISERIVGNCRSLSRTPLEKADLRSVNLSNTNLRGTDLSFADLSFANVRRTDLSFANLRFSNLRGTNLSSANLSSAIILTADFRKIEALTRQQLEGKTAPLLCNVALPQNLQASVNPNRDCDRLPQILLERYPEEFNTLEKAKAYVDEARKKRWDN